MKISAIKAEKLPKNLEFEYVDKAPSPGINAYWVRIVQEDGAMAWSSPVYYNFEG